MNDVNVDQVEEQSMRIHLTLGGDPDDGWPLIEERTAVKLLDQLSNANRKALRDVANVEGNLKGFAGIDFMVADARLLRAHADAVAYSWSWTPAPGRSITLQQLIALKHSQYLLASIEWDCETQSSSSAR